MSLAANFNLLDEFNILRLICGIFLIPHIVAKFTNPATLNFFIAARFKPPAFWMYVAGGVETVLATLLILGVYPRYVGAVACFHLLVAAAGTWRTSKHQWIWVVGGIEFCVFWAICCLVVAMHG